MSSTEEEGGRKKDPPGKNLKVPSFKDQSRSVISPPPVQAVQVSAACQLLSVESQGSKEDTSVSGTLSRDQNQLLCVVAATPVDDEEEGSLGGEEGSAVKIATLKVEDTEDHPTSNQHGNKAEEPKVGTCSKNKKWWIAVGLVAVVAAVAIGIGVAVGVTGGGDEDDSFEQVGRTLGGSKDWLFGSSVSLNKDGTKMAVASSTAPSDEDENQRGSIQVFTLQEQDPAWIQSGQTIPVGARDFDDSLSDIPNELLQLFDRRLSVVLNGDGNRLVLGAPYHDDPTGTGTNLGLARVFTKRPDGEELWTQVGNDIVGREEDELLGSSVSINDEGDRIAVGSPGHSNGTGTVTVYDLYDGSWGPIGTPISDGRADGKVGVSVSLSAKGDRVAVGSLSKSEETTVVRVFQFDEFGAPPTWVELGMGIQGGNALSMTSWTVSLSADGGRVLISNNYLSKEDFTNEDPNSLVVEVYDYDEGTKEWKLVGENIHADKPGKKTGYWVSMSNDGRTIGMGDPGTSEGGRSRGHAHTYRFDGSHWNQIGPDIEGKADGDNFGFSVSLSGDARHLAVGAPFSREFADRAGSVQVFEIHK
jgi:hypothetical protein